MSLADLEIARLKWDELREMDGPATNVGQALSGLLSARTAAEAEAWYWKLENRVVVQGRLYEAAEYVVPVLIAALVDDRPRHVRFSLLDLLFQIVNGTTDPDEVDAGNADLAEKCRSRAREGIWLFYRDLMLGFRDATIDLIRKLENDPDRLQYYLKHAPEPA
jgi:hypothetical protein